MPIYKNKGLQGLRSFREIGRNAQKEFMQSIQDKNPNMNLSSLNWDDWDEIYHKKQFTDAFGSDLYNQVTDRQEREELFRQSVVNSAINEQYGDQENILPTLNQLTTQGKIDFLESGYYTTDELNQHLGTIDKFSYAGMGDNDMLTPFGKVMMQSTGTALTAEQQANAKKEILQEQQNKLDHVVTTDIDRQIQSMRSTGIPDQVYNTFRDNLAKGTVTIDQYLKAFDDIFTRNQVDEFGHYLYKNDQGQMVYTDENGQEQLAPSKVTMSDEEWAIYQTTDEYKQRLANAELQDRQTNQVGRSHPELRQRDVRIFDNPGSRYYNAFKDSEELENLDDTAKLRMLADYLTTANLVGEDKALMFSEREMQKMVADNQGTFANWGKAFGAQALSQLCGGIASVPLLFSSQEEKVNLMNGKNRDGSEREGWSFWDPTYWDKATQYNTLSLSAIAEAEANGGIGRHQKIWDPAVEESVLNGQMLLYEGTKMGAFAVGDLALSYLTMGTTGAVVKGVNIGSKILRTTGEVGGIANRVGRAGVQLSVAMNKGRAYIQPVLSAMAISSAYSQQTYNNVIQQGNETIDQYKMADASQYAKNLMGTDAYRQAVDAYYTQNYDPSKAGQMNRVIQQDGSLKYESYEQQLHNQAEQYVSNLAKNEYLNNPNIQKQFNRDYGAMKHELELDAAAALTTDYLLELAANSYNQLNFRKWAMAPAQRRLLEVNNARIKGGFAWKDGKLFFNTAKGGAGRKATVNTYLRNVAHNIRGGGQSNYLDDVRVAYAQGLGLGMFNNYMDHTYDPDNAAQVLDTGSSFLSAMYSAHTSALNSLTAKGTIRDGIIGAVGSTISLGPNLGAMVDKNTYRNPVTGKRRTFMQSMGRFVSNPLLNEWYATQEKADNSVKFAEQMNQYLADNMSSIENIGNMAQAAYKAIEIANNGHPATLSQEGNSDKLEQSLEGAVVDAQVLQAFEIIRNLNDWKGDEIMMANQGIANAIQQWENFMNGKFDQRTIETFMNSKDNQAYMKGMSEEMKQQYARETLQKNATKLKQMYDKFQQASKEIVEYSTAGEALQRNHKDVFNQLVFQTIMDENWNERLEKIQSELGSSKEGTHGVWYGSKGNYDAQVRARQKVIQGLKDRLESVKKEQYENDEDYSRSENRKMRRAFRESRRLLAENYQKRIQEEQNQLDMMLADGKYYTESTEPIILSGEEIMGLAPEERAYMLNPDNMKHYSEQQRNVLQQLRQDLATQDQNYMEKVNDAIILQDRIKANAQSRKMLLTNPSLAVNYSQVLQESRKYRLARAAYEKQMIDQMVRWDKVSVEDIEEAVRSSYPSRELIDLYENERPEIKGMLDNYKEVVMLQDELREAIAQADVPERMKSFALMKLLSGTNTSNSYEQAADRAEVAANAVLNTTASWFEFEEAQKYAQLLDEAFKKINEIKGSQIFRTDRSGAIEKAKKKYEKQEKRQQEVAQRQLQQRGEKKEKKPLRQVSIDEYFKKSQEEKQNRNTEANKQEAMKQSEKIIQRLFQQMTTVTIGKKNRQTSMNNLLSRIPTDQSLAIRITQLLEKYHNHLEEYGDAHSTRFDERIGFIEEMIKECGYTWESVEGRQLVDAHQFEVESTVETDNLYEDQLLATNTTPYVYKDGQLVARPVVGTLVVGTRSYDNPIVATQKNEVEEITKTTEESTEVSGNMFEEEAAPQEETQEETPVEEQEETPEETPEEQPAEEKVDEETPEDSNLPLGPSQEEQVEEVSEEEIQEEENKGDEEFAQEDSRTIEEVVEQQLQENPQLDVIIEDSDASNTVEEEVEISGENDMIGNYMTEYDNDAVQQMGIAKRKEVKKIGGIFDKFMQWQDKNGIKLQEIIDREFGRMIAKNPDMKIRFMKLASSEGIDNILLVVEYNDEVKRQHDESLGGVLSDGDGKSWLVVGTYGFGRNDERQASAYRAINERLGNPSKNTVLEGAYTKVKRYSNGWPVKQGVGDTQVKTRSLREIMADSQRNPDGLGFGGLKFGMQVGKKFVVYNMGNAKFKQPRAILDGSSYVMVKSANGEFVPFYIQPSRYADLQQGRMKDKIDELTGLTGLLSSDYQVRREAKRQLKQLLFLEDADGPNKNTILIGNESTNIVTIVRGDQKVTFPCTTQSLGNFMNEFRASNYRVNVTAQVFQSEQLFNMYNEAGALNTDAAALYPMNANYFVYQTDMVTGEPIITESVKPVSQRENKVLSTVYYRGSGYRQYAHEAGIWRTFNDVVVTDEKTLEQLNMLKMIEGMMPAYTNPSNKNNYYLVSVDGDNTIGISENSRTRQLQYLTPEQVKQVIQKIDEVNRRKNAAEALTNENSLASGSMFSETAQQEVATGVAGSMFEAENQTVEETPTEKQKPEQENHYNVDKSDKNLGVIQEKSSTFAADEIIFNSSAGREVAKRIIRIIQAKAKADAEWKAFSKMSPAERQKFYEKKGIAYTGITDVEAWIKHIEECK